MSTTSNPLNNYSVQIITESNLGNISPSNGPGEGIEFSATTNSPFVTLKIIPTNPQTQPVLASNIKIDDIIPDFAWNAGVNYNTNGICMPPPTPQRSPPYPCPWSGPSPFLTMAVLVEKTVFCN